MACEWHEKLDRYVDAELAPDELARCEQHLQTCPQCAAEVLGHLQLKRAVRRAVEGKYEPESQLRLKIIAALNPVRRGPSRFWSPRLQFATAAVAVLALAIAAWLARPQRSDPLTELVDLHVTTMASANPVDVISSDRHAVKPWFEGKLPFSFNLPDLTGTPFRLIGGRVAYFEQEPGAQLLFAVGKHQVSVFIFQRTEYRLKSGTAPVSGHNLGFTVENWSQDGLVYIIVGDAEPSRIEALRHRLQVAAKDTR